MIGASTASPSSAGSSSVSAAKKWYRKSLYYIDNVDGSMTEDSMKSFIHSLSVRLLSCYAVKQCRRHHRHQLSDDDDDDDDDG